MSNMMLDDNEARYGDVAGYGAVEPLSGAGRARRDALLPVLEAAVVREGRRRRVRRYAMRSATAAVLLAVGVGLVANWPSSQNQRLAGRGSAEGPREAAGRVVTLHSRPGVLDRYVVATSFNPADYTMDDRTLVDTLAAIGRPAGLIRVSGRIRLTNPVTDLELFPPQPKTPTGADARRDPT